METWKVCIKKNGDVEETIDIIGKDIKEVVASLYMYFQTVNVEEIYEIRMKKK